MARPEAFGVAPRALNTAGKAGRKKTATKKVKKSSVGKKKPGKKGKKAAKAPVAPPAAVARRLGAQAAPLPFAPAGAATPSGSPWSQRTAARRKVRAMTEEEREIRESLVTLCGARPCPACPPKPPATP